MHMLTTPTSCDCRFNSGSSEAICIAPVAPAEMSQSLLLCSLEKRGQLTKRVASRDSSALRIHFRLVNP
jgi:hypothetical protein